MIVGVLRIRLAVPAETLKEKRAIVKSLVDRLRRRFNAAVAEVEDLDSASRATVAVCCVSNDASHVERQLATIARVAEDLRLDVEILSIETELMHL